MGECHKLLLPKKEDVDSLAAAQYNRLYTRRQWWPTVSNRMAFQVYSKIRKPFHGHIQYTGAAS